MKIVYLFLILNLLFPEGPKTISANTDLLATQLHPYGRYRITARSQVELISSACHVGFSFKGGECEVFASISDTNGHNYLQYELDGIYVGRIKINGKSKESYLIKASGKGMHVVWPPVPYL